MLLAPRCAFFFFNTADVALTNLSEMAESYPSGVASMSAAAQRRQTQMQTWMGKLPAQFGPATPQSELSALRANTGAVGHFSVFYNCRRSNAAGSVDKVLGNACRAYSEKLTLQRKLLKWL